jgi:UDP-GlcNAc3NAcA epimerase
MVQDLYGWKGSCFVKSAAEDEGGFQMKVVNLVGARPQFIKAATVTRAIHRHNLDHSSPNISEIIVHTGQHYDYNMSQVFFEELKIPEPQYNLGIGSGSHGQMTGAMLQKIEQVLVKEQPDWIIVYGDTNSTMAGALAAAKLHIPVAHVEAGLRSFNRRMPEEINRVLTDHVSSLLFCPSETAVQNLEKEGITVGVHNVGDVMYDALLYNGEKASDPLRREPYALASLHRAENTGDQERMRSILSAMGKSPVRIVFPIHPRTRYTLKRYGISLDTQIEMLDPQPYLSMLGYLKGCSFVITDSGGLQKEAYFFGKKCITIRDETEWTELVDYGVNRVVGAEELAIRNSFSWAMESSAMPNGIYGTGDAAVKIVKHLLGMCQ